MNIFEPKIFPIYPKLSLLFKELALCYAEEKLVKGLYYG